MIARVCAAAIGGAKVVRRIELAVNRYGIEQHNNAASVRGFVRCGKAVAVSGFAIATCRPIRQWPLLGVETAPSGELRQRKEEASR